jgi:hypothetical protein
MRVRVHEDKVMLGSSTQSVDAMAVLDISIESATARLTDTILGKDERDLAEILREIASEIGVSHMAYLRLSPDKSTDVALLVAIATYSRAWQQRYLLGNMCRLTP